LVNIYLIRHGETKWNREKVFRGQMDIPLNEFGRLQAEKLSETLKMQKLKNPVFISSPLKRARETAEIATNLFAKAEININDAFIDISFGQWEGLPLHEIESDYPDLYQTWVQNPEKVDFPNGENIKVVADRAEEGIYQAVHANPESELVIVAHRVINKALLCRLLGMELKAFWKLRQDTACLNELYFDKDDFILVRLNDTCHLKSLETDIIDF